MCHPLRTIVVLVSLVVTTSTCAGNYAAAPTGWVDHNNDGYEDGGM